MTSGAKCLLEHWGNGAESLMGHLDFGVNCPLGHWGIEARCLGQTVSWGELSVKPQSYSQFNLSYVVRQF